MKSWLKNPIHIAVIIVIGIVFFAVIIPLMINGLYQLDGAIITQWDCSDALLFYGSVLGACGTIVLGIVSVYQNIKAQELNMRVENNNKELQKLTEAQFVSFVSLSKYQVSINSSKYPTHCYNKEKKKIEIIDLTDKQFLSNNSTYECYHIDCKTVK